MRLTINRFGGAIAAGSALRSGGGDSFESFYRREYPGVVRLAWLLTGEPTICEDVVQDAFGQLLPRFNDVANPSAYLRSIVVNGCRQRFRRSTREARRLRLISARVDEHTTDRPDELADALSRLPDRQRAAVVLRYWADLPEAEIAALLAVRPSTVRTLVSRALAALREEIEP
jgi:RNA polymerase sigma-70 factor (sigma-E family)